MSGKFFSLINGGDIHVAPSTRIIPEKQFSTALDGRQLLEKVQEDMQQYRQQVEKECEELKEQSKKEGFQQGLEQWNEKLRELEDHIRKLEEEYTRKLAPIALKAAQKIVGKAFETSDSLIFAIVSNALKPVLAHKKITIWVNKQDLEQLEAKKGDLKALFEDVKSLSIQEKQDIQPGECIIETEGGIINATFANQWNILEKVFNDLFPSQENVPAPEVASKEKEE